MINARADNICKLIAAQVCTVTFNIYARTYIMAMDDSTMTKLMLPYYSKGNHAPTGMGSGFCKMAKRFVYESAARKVQQLAVTHQATMLSPVPYRVSA